jgi:catechol 2,3-dioxygenase-like lactoylglutathione lyase family enzyme
LTVATEASRHWNSPTGGVKLHQLRVELAQAGEEIRTMYKPLQILAILLLLAITDSVVAQSSNTSEPIISGAIKPSLIAISVANVDETAKWYQDHLGFRLQEKKDYPQASLRIAFLELNGFEIELVEDKKSIALAAIQKHLPEAKDGTNIQGFVKLAFTVEDVEGLAAKLKTKGVRLHMEVTKSNRKEGIKFFIVKDNNGNWLQFFGSSK